MQCSTIILQTSHWHCLRTHLYILFVECWVVLPKTQLVWCYTHWRSTNWEWDPNTNGRISCHPCSEKPTAALQSVRFRSDKSWSSPKSSLRRKRSQWRTEQSPFFKNYDIPILSIKSKEQSQVMVSMSNICIHYSDCTFWRNSENTPKRNCTLCKWRDLNTKHILKVDRANTVKICWGKIRQFNCRCYKSGDRCI